MKRNRDAYERIIKVIDERNNYTLKISKKLNMTHAHIQKCIQKLIDEGIIIKLPKQKRKIILKLSDKGEKIKQIYFDLDNAYSEAKK